LIDEGFITMIASQVLDTIDISEKSDALPVFGECQYYLLLLNSSEYKEGEAAYSCGLTTRNNPYLFGSSEFWRWQEGLLGNGYPRER
jgi:hypothetical protein